LVARTWCDILQPETAEVLAVYSADFFAGQAAVTLNRFQAGQVLTLGSFGDSAFFTALQPWLCKLTSIQPVAQTPNGVEAVQRDGLLFLLNHTPEEQSIDIKAPYQALLPLASMVSTIKLSSFGVAVLKIGNENG